MQQRRLSEFKAALVDMDGTLYDSMPFHARAWHRMVSEQLGIKAPLEEFFLYEGMTGKATIDLLLKREYGRESTPEEVEKFYGFKTKYFREMPPVEVMPGAKLLVKKLQEAGLKLVLVTGSGQNSLISRLDQDFDNAFKLRITSHDVTHGKPHPEPFLKAAELAGYSPKECVAIENAPLGIMSARAAGVYAVAVTTGPIPREAFEKAGANEIYPSMPQAAEMLLI